MTLVPKELFGDPVSQTPNLRAYPYQDGIKVGTLASFAADTDLAHLTPLFFDNTAGFWNVWAGASNEVNTLTADATPASAGTFTLTVNGVTSAAIAFNATAAVIQAALEAMPNIAPGDVTAVATTGANLGVANAVVTLNWAGAFAGTNVVITADQALISAGNDFVLATTTAGGSNPSDGGLIDGFLWAPDEPHTALLAGETHIQVFRMGVIHAADIPVPSGESQTNLNAALLASSLREKGINLQGIAGVY